MAGKKQKKTKMELTKKQKRGLAAIAFFAVPWLVNFLVGFEFALAVALIEVALFVVPYYWLKWKARQKRKK